MRILVKIGGAQLERPDAQRELCRGLARARREGHELIVVHGGGNQIRSLCRSLGLPEAYHDGLRITDAATAEVVLMVLGGLVNRTLVAAMQRCGLGAVGLSGADGGTFTAAPLQRPGVELGFVGEIAAVDPRLVRTLLASGHVPVLATTAPRAGAADGEPFWNVNADHAAGPLARAFGCDAVLFLTDVPGVLDDQRRTLPELDAAGCRQLIAAGTARGGMLPKLESALAAAAANPRALVKIAPADGPDAVLAALRRNIGTRIHHLDAAGVRMEGHDG